MEPIPIPIPLPSSASPPLSISLNFSLPLSIPLCACAPQDEPDTPCCFAAGLPRTLSSSAVRPPLPLGFRARSPPPPARTSSPGDGRSLLNLRPRGFLPRGRPRAMPARPHHRAAWRGALAVGAALRAAHGSRHLAQLCGGHECTALEAPLLDYDPVEEKCRCIPHPCWDDNGRQHFCQDDVRHPFLAFSYDQSGGLQCRCSSIAQQNSVYLSKHVCAGQKCDQASFPVLDVDDGGECRCLAHPCWNDNGLNHSCSSTPRFPILNFRLDKEGSNVCECMAMWHPQGKNVLEDAAKEDEQRQAAQSNMEHGFPMPPDTRPRGCAKNITEDFSGLSVSVIIPWLAEKWYHMEATLKSLLYFTPDHLVTEFIFISDGNADSREVELKAISDKVRVLALRERVGLMVAKTKGVEMAKAPVLVFLEAHCIMNHGWLEPLLQRLKEDPKILAMPQLDIIPEDNFYQYRKNVPGYWRYEWNFNLIYSNPGGGLIKDSRTKSEPYLSPGTSGGIFAMRRDWFNHLGFFDEGMEQWGGDHIELTMKVWRCGGRIEVVPCSRIGHLFRTPAKRPYDVEVAQVVKNYARLARVWAGNYLDTFYKMKPEARAFEVPDLDELQRQHDELGCHSMDWYVQNVDIEMGWEADKVCIPGGDTRSGGCSGPSLAARSTIDQTMPREEYLQGRAKADASLEASRSGERRPGKAWAYEARLEL
ncbi:unnamed protein product [Prorocentrum cordatum]|uniref:Glycosyltransferase 2-like domain-containing protein n=2 Tax=Prorocentrum cordatum TaxID=2364126 RepID=A0ABN9UP90_9DINO|nr:unnamed protein product [Polarella glacialis]